GRLGVVERLATLVHPAVEAGLEVHAGHADLPGAGLGHVADLPPPRGAVPAGLRGDYHPHRLRSRLPDRAVAPGPGPAQGAPLLGDLAGGPLAPSAERDAGGIEEPRAPPRAQRPPPTPVLLEERFWLRHRRAGEAQPIDRSLVDHEARLGVAAEA